MEIKSVLRAQWTAIANAHLKAHGIEARIDHRTLREQGIDREPTTHLGPAVSALERRGIKTEVGKRIFWQRQAAAQARLEQAAELGKIEREKEAVQCSILDLSGDLNAARRGREQAPPAASSGAKKTVVEIQAEARQQWLAQRKLASSKESQNPAQRAVEEWREYRRQQDLKPGEVKESDQEAESDRKKKRDHGVDYDYGI